MTVLRLLVIGPSGSGKSVLGAAVAARLGAVFVDADALHPVANVAKMAKGIPLDDADRLPWLDAVGATLAGASGPTVVACSALRRAYRERILQTAPDALFVALITPESELQRRMGAREHFMPVSLLASQLAAWEPLGTGEPGLSVDNVGDPAEVVGEIVSRLEEERGAQFLR
jgi:carbohydrate kinase (thermoresistant glucokinase family)